jgi:hypothetical protein
MSSIIPKLNRFKTFKLITMQNNNNTASRKMNTPVYKTFCKVCQDSGKCEKDYTNHNVRDKTGKTVCPTLLAQECKNCYKRGHTVKYCPLLKAAPVQPTAKSVTKAQPVKRAVPKNVFMVFDDESESDNDIEVKDEPVQEFPTLNAVTLNAVTLNAPMTVQKPVLNYGKIISQVNDPATYAKEKEAEMQEKVKKYAEEQEARRQKLEAERKAVKEARDARIKANAGKKFSWADAESDSEGDEEEEEEVAPKKVVQQQIVDNSAW